MIELIGGHWVRSPEIAGLVNLRAATALYVADYHDTLDNLSGHEVRAVMLPYGGGDITAGQPDPFGNPNSSLRVLNVLVHSSVAISDLYPTQVAALAALDDLVERLHDEAR